MYEDEKISYVTEPEAKQPLYKKYVKELWAISSEIESKLDHIIYPEGPQADEADSGTRLESELKRLVRRYNEISQRISL